MNLLNKPCPSGWVRYLSVVVILLSAAFGLLAPASADDNVWLHDRFGIVLSYSNDYEPLSIPEGDRHELILEASGYDEGTGPYHEQVFVEILAGRPGSDFSPEEVSFLKQAVTAAGGRIEEALETSIAYTPALYISLNMVDASGTALHITHAFLKLDGRILSLTARSATDPNFEVWRGHEFGDMLAALRIRGRFPSADPEVWQMSGLYTLPPQPGWHLIAAETGRRTYASDDWLTRISLTQVAWDEGWTPEWSGLDVPVGTGMDNIFAPCLSCEVSALAHGMSSFNSADWQGDPDTPLDRISFKAEHARLRHGNPPQRRKVLHGRLSDRLVVIVIEDRRAEGAPFSGHDLLSRIRWTRGQP